MEEKGRIGIPRALMFYRYFPLWHTFFERVGWRVVVSDGVRQKEKIIYFEDSCLPMKLLVTHAAFLKDKVDHLFIPRLVSLHRTYIMCPKFRGAPDIVRLATDGNVSIIDETIDLRKGGNSLFRSFLRMGEKLGTSKQESRRAFREGVAPRARSVSPAPQGNRRGMHPLREGYAYGEAVPLQVGYVYLVGHPFGGVLCDH